MASATCAVCESAASQGGRPLYDTILCRTCRTEFTRRRAAAFALDVVAWAGTAIVLTLVIRGVAALYEPHVRAALEGMAPAVAASLALVAFAFKDGLFDGRSPGKARLGLRVVDERTRRPIGPGVALVRTLPLLVPGLPFVAAWQLGGGHRIGDGAAGTRVVWDVHSTRPPFVAHLLRPGSSVRPVPAATTAAADPWH